MPMIEKISPAFMFQQTQAVAYLGSAARVETGPNSDWVLLVLSTEAEAVLVQTTVDEVVLELSLDIGLRIAAVLKALTLNGIYKSIKPVANTSTVLRVSPPTVAWRITRNCDSVEVTERQKESVELLLHPTLADAAATELLRAIGLHPDQIERTPDQGSS